VKNHFLFAVARALALSFAAVIPFANLATPLPAETPATNSPAWNRYLFVVDTSRTMEKRADAVEQLIVGLLASGMNGQLRRGDTLGIWTFNDGLHAGKFPLQAWAPETARPIAQRTVKFLRDQKYEKSARMEKVMPEIGRLIKDSKFITVILISSGDSSIAGTPFDASINASYNKWRREQDKARMPISTVLRARGGVITDFVVNPAPWPIEFPPLPAELLVENPKPEPPKPPAPKPPPIGQSIILSGKKTEPAPVEPAPDARPQSEALQPGGSPEKPATPGRRPEEPSPAPRSEADEQGTMLRAADRSPTFAESITAPKLEITDDVPESDGVGIGIPLVVLVTAPQNAESPDETIAGRRPPVDSPPAAPASTAGENSDSALAQPVVAMPAQSLSSRKSIWIGALALMAVALALIFVVSRRSRQASHASLITSSLDRDKK
jgi:hypothetical protein